MDFFPITSACTALHTSSNRTVGSIIRFSSRVREAREDVDTLLRELASLRSVVYYIEKDTTGVQPTREFQHHIRSVLQDCEHVFRKLNALASKLQDGSLSGFFWNDSTERRKLETLTASVRVQKHVLSIALSSIDL